jgi:hypothetical protein
MIRNGVGGHRTQRNGQGKGVETHAMNFVFLQSRGDGRDYKRLNADLSPTKRA